MFVSKPSEHNPILVPDDNRYFEAAAAFNMCPVKIGSKTVGVYRALSKADRLHMPEQLSVVAIAESDDATHFKDRKPFIVPEAEWEKYGCEDPRVTFFEGKYYIFYTALSTFPFGSSGIKVAVGISSDLKKVDERHLVTPFNAKAMTLFPERVNGKIVVLLSAHTDSPPAKMAIAKLDSIEQLWSSDFWNDWHRRIDNFVIDPRRSPYDHVEVGAPPIKTEKGYLVVYSHIQNYFPNPGGFNRIFGIEALLLDLNDPTLIVSRTKGPLLISEVPFKKDSLADILFPSGAMVEGDTLTMFYGVGDETVGKASVSLTDLLGTMDPQTLPTWSFVRAPQNPIITPEPDYAFEAQSTMNPAAIEIDGTVHILYRALANDNTSTFGYASSKDGFHLDERLQEPIYVPREDFEMKKNPGGNSGCEDPRLTKIGDKIYMCYTAYDGVNPPRAAITSILETDFVAKNWSWTKPMLITPPGVDDKDSCVLSEKINGNYFILHRIGTDICGDYVSSLDNDMSMVKRCFRVLGPRLNGWDSDKVGITAPPMKTDKGWLLLYHGVSKSHHTYRVGAALLSLEDPAIVLARSTDPIFEPTEAWEKNGIVSNVVFPCGMVLRDGKLFIYYGGGDRVVGVATMSYDVVMNALLRGAKL